MINSKTTLRLAVLVGLTLAVSMPASDILRPHYASVSTLTATLCMTGIIAACSLGLLVVLLLQTRRPVTFTSGRFEWRFGLPLLSTGLLFWAGFYPALMSPDSVTQWTNIMNAEWSAAHANIISWLLYPLVQVWPSPAIVPAIQIPLLSAAVAFLLSEQQRWSVPKPLLWIAAILIAVIPFNPLLSVHFWKDIPYAAAMLFVTALIQELIRTEGAALKERRWKFRLVVAVLAVMLVRHNGLAIPALLLPLLLWLYRSAWRSVLAVSVAIAAIFAGYQLLLPIAGVRPLGAHYQASLPIHIMGAYLQDDSRLERLTPVLPRILPASEWRAGYNCQNSISLFWNKQIDYGAAAKEKDALWRLVLSEVYSDPAVLLEHQLCVTSVLWRILPAQGDTMVRAMYGIADMEEARAIGLKEQSLVPELREKLTRIASHVSLENVWRPASYLFMSFVLAASLWSSRPDPRVLLMFIPMWANTLGLALFMQSPDFRYQWPLILAILCLWPLFFRGAWSKLSGPAGRDARSS